MNHQVIEYLTNALSAEARIEFENQMLQNADLRKEVDEWRGVFDGMAEEGAVQAPARSKKRFLDAVDSIAKEEVTEPPILHPGSKAEDYAPWLEREDVVEPEEYDNLHYVPLAQSEEGFTIVVWMKEGLPSEVHNDTIERFLVLEGTCDIDFDGVAHSLKPGDFLSIPLHLPHTVKVTSTTTCQMIVQRHAA